MAFHFVKYPHLPYFILGCNRTITNTTMSQGRGEEAKNRKSGSLPNTFDDDCSMAGFVLTDSVTRLSSGHLNM